MAVWEVTPGLYPVPVFPSRNGHFMSKVFRAHSLLEIERQILPSKCSSVRQKGLHGLNLDSIRPVDCSVTAVTLDNCRYRHLTAEREMFAARAIRKRSLIGYYYGALVYQDLKIGSWSSKTY